MIIKNMNHARGGMGGLFLGSIFLIIGAANSEYRLAILAGILFIIGGVIHMVKEYKNRNTD